MRRPYVLALELSGDVMAENLRRTCLQHSAGRHRRRTADGDRYVTATPQVFDTAIAVLALSLLEVEPRLARSTYRPEELKEAIAKGKAYSCRSNAPDGSWPETTQAGGSRKLRAAHLDDRLGDAGAVRKLTRALARHLRHLRHPRQSYLTLNGIVVRSGSAARCRSDRS